MRYYEADESVLREGDEVNEIMIVVHGSLEVFTEFEGNTFIIETLKPGSILNYKSIFTDDVMKV